MDLANIIKQKLGPVVRKNYFPPKLIALFEALDAETQDEQEAVLSVASGFIRSLGRMTENERWLIGTIFAVGCETEMPENVHVELDIVRRDLGMPVAEIESKL